MEYFGISELPKMVAATKSDQPNDVEFVYDEGGYADEDKKRKEIERLSSAVAAASTNDDDADADDDDDLGESASLPTTRFS